MEGELRALKEKKEEDVFYQLHPGMKGKRGEKSFMLLSSHFQFAIPETG